jgi:hypothetical protein
MLLKGETKIFEKFGKFQDDDDDGMPISSVDKFQFLVYLFS